MSPARFLALTACCIIALALVACGGQSARTEHQSAAPVAATTTVETTTVVEDETMLPGVHQLGDGHASDAAPRVVRLEATAGVDVDTSTLLAAYPNAVQIDQLDLPPDARGRWTRLRLLRSDFKYPLLRVEDRLVLSADGQSAELLGRQVMVADHLMVGLRQADATQALVAQVDGIDVRRQRPGSTIALISFNGKDLLAMDRLEQEIAAQGMVRVVEPDFVVHALVEPDDPSYTQLWGMNNANDADIDAPEAWDITTGSADVLVGVIDTGIDRDHPDLAGNMWVNPGEDGLDGNGQDKRTNGIDDDANGYIDDWRGWDFVNNDNDPDDDHYHGTHCAGTIGAEGDNATGVVGVAWDVSLVGLKFLSASGGGTISDAIDAVFYANSIGCDLTSNSWGGGGFSQLLKDAIDAAGAEGHLFVAAAGNSNVDNDVSPHYPSSYESENIIAVAAMTSSEQRSSFSCWGALSVDIFAPGSDIYSTKPNNTYGLLSGTSMATPHVSGACALLWAANPSLTAIELKTALMETVDVFPQYTGQVVSDGRMNVAAALTQVAGSYLKVVSHEYIELGDGDGLFEPGEMMKIAMVLQSAGVDPVLGANATLTTDHAAVVVLTDYQPLPDLQPGETVAIVWDLAIGSTVPVPSLITADFSATNGSDTWTNDLPFMVTQSALVSGYVVRRGSGEPLSGATVGLADNTIQTISAADGSYSLELPAGSHELVCTADGLIEETQSGITTPPDQQVNWELGAPDMTAKPGNLVMTVTQGASATGTIVTGNTGDAELQWTISVGLSGGTLPPPQADGLWHESSYRHNGDGAAWYYGQESTRNYDTGSTNSGSLAFHDVNVPVGASGLHFDFWRSTEGGTSWDRSLVQVSTDGGASWTSVLQVTDNSQVWNSELADLSAFAGQMVSLRFYFDTVDSISNAYEGWYVDNIRFEPIGTTATAIAAHVASRGARRDGVQTVELNPELQPTATSVPLFSASPQKGIIQVGAPSLPVVITANGSLAAGDYEAEARFTTNVPDQNEIIVPITLTVLPAPMLSAQGLNLRDDLPQAIGDGDGYAEPGETWVLSVDVVNAGDADGTGLVCTPSTTTSGISIIDDQVPTVALANSTTTATWLVTIDDTIAQPQTFAYEVALAADNGWNDSLAGGTAIAWRCLVAGTVVQANQPLAGASVSLAGVGTVLTGTDGAFAFNAVAAGTYDLQAAMDGDSVGTTVVLPPDAVDLQLVLASAEIAVEPLAVNAVLAGETNETVELTLSVTGDRSVEWSVEVVQPSEAQTDGLWHASTYRSIDGQAWYYGQEATRDYDTGGSNSGSLTFVDVVVPADDPNLRWQEWLQTESSYDYARTEISTDGGVSWISLRSTSASSGGVWRALNLDLSTYTGQTVDIRFRFTADYSVFYEGWYIDAITLGGTSLEASGEIVWLDLPGVTNGVIAAGETATLDVALDSTVIDYGTYEAQLRIFSDASNGNLMVPVQIEHASANEPVASNVTAEGDEDQSITVTLEGSDADGDALTYTIVDQPDVGVILSQNGDQVVYRGPADFNGTTSFSYKVSDGWYESGVATATITVLPVNDLVRLSGGPYAVQTGVQTDLPFTAFDPDGDAIEISFGTYGNVDPITTSMAQIELLGNSLRYTPAFGQQGTETVKLYASDGNGAVVRYLDITVHPFQATAAWGTLGGNPARTGFVGGQIDVSGIALEQSVAIGVNDTPPIIGDGRVYLAANSSQNLDDLRAYDLQSGAQLWAVPVNNSSFVSDPTFADGAVYLQRCNHSNDSQLFKLDATDGSEIWQSPWSCQWESYLAPCVADGAVYIGGGYYGGMYGFDEGTGSQTFWLALDQYDDWTPSYRDGKLYSYSNGKFREHDKQSGAVLRSITLPKNWRGYDVDTAAVIGGERAYILSWSSPVTLNAVDLSSMTIAWQVTGSFRGLPATDGDGVFVYDADGIQEYAATDGSLRASYAISTASASIGSTVTSQQPILFTNAVLGSSDQETALFERGGDRLWSTSQAGHLAYVEGRLVIGGIDDQLHLFSAGPSTAPVLYDLSVNGVEDEIIAGRLLGGDPDGDDVTPIVQQVPANGSLTWGDNGAFTYTPDADWFGSDSFVVVVDDGGNLSNAATVTITVAPVNDPPVILEATASRYRVRVGDTVDLSGAWSDVDNDETDIFNAWFTVGGDPYAVTWLTGNGDDQETIKITAVGVYTLQYYINDGSGAVTQEMEIEAVPYTPDLNHFVLSDVGSEWTEVDLPIVYTDPVVIATPRYDAGQLPVVTRVKVLANDKIAVRVQNPSNAVIDGGYGVHLIAVEAGFYNEAEHGVKMVVNKLTVDAVNHDSDWVAKNVSYGPFDNPVVLGQVMGEDDADWSVFFATGFNREDIPGTTSRLGAHVGEDPDDARSVQIMGHIIMEAGSGFIGDVPYQAGVGADTVLGMHDDPPYAYALGAVPYPQTAVLSAAGMDGVNGGWPVLTGPGISPAGLHLAIDEDQLKDSERNHTSEQVAFLVLGGDAPAIAAPMMHVDSVDGVGDAWQTIDLPAGFSQPVVVATVHYPDAQAAPAIARLRNVTASGFELRVQDPAGAARSGYAVEIFAIEAGVYNYLEHGIQAEAALVDATVVDGKNAWLGTAYDYQGGYAAPVVLGSVQTANDDGWSSFWSRGSSQTSVPSTSQCFIGMHVGEDSRSGRLLEQLGVVVIESGSYALGGLILEAGIGADIVGGMHNNPPYAYPVASSAPFAAVLSSMAMDGGDGAWPVLLDIGSGSMGVAVDEDTVGDSERGHTTEQLGYCVFDVIGGDG